MTILGTTLSVACSASVSFVKAAVSRELPYSTMIRWTTARAMVANACDGDSRCLEMVLVYSTMILEVTAPAYCSRALDTDSGVLEMVLAYSAITCGLTPPAAFVRPGEGSKVSSWTVSAFSVMMLLIAAFAPWAELRSCPMAATVNRVTVRCIRRALFLPTRAQIPTLPCRRERSLQKNHCV